MHIANKKKNKSRKEQKQKLKSKKNRIKCKSNIKSNYGHSDLSKVLSPKVILPLTLQVFGLILMIFFYQPPILPL